MRETRLTAWLAYWVGPEEVPVALAALAVALVTTVGIAWEEWYGPPLPTALHDTPALYGVLLRLVLLLAMLLGWLLGVTTIARRAEAAQQGALEEWQRRRMGVRLGVVIVTAAVPVLAGLGHLRLRQTLALAMQTGQLMAVSVVSGLVMGHILPVRWK